MVKELCNRIYKVYGENVIRHSPFFRDVYFDKKILAYFDEIYYHTYMTRNP